MLAHVIRNQYGTVARMILPHEHLNSLAELERWAERLLDARNLAELFDDNAVEA